MIAREREFADLCSRLSSVATGTGTTALICGEPGIGKTTLADALAIEAVSRGVNVAWGRCWEVLGGPAYWPWIQVLRSLFDEVDRSDSRPQLESEAAFIRRCIPELIPPSGVPFAAEPGVPTSTTQNDPEVLRFELFESVLRLLTIASRNAARLLIFDDCHAADEPSLRLLDFVAKQIRQTHVMLLITYRETDIRHRALAHDIVTGLAREGHRYSLQNLAEDDVRAFLAERAPGINEAGLAKRLFHTTEGN